MRKMFTLFLVVFFSLFINIYAESEMGLIDTDIAKEIIRLEKHGKIVNDDNVWKKTIFGDFDKHPFSLGISVPSVVIEESSKVSSSVIFFLQYKLNKFSAALYYVLGANIETKISEQGFSGKVILSSPLILALKYYYINDDKKFRLFFGIGEQYSIISNDSFLYTDGNNVIKLKTKLSNNGLNPVFLIGGETQLTSNLWILLEMNICHFSSEVTGIPNNLKTLPINTIYTAMGFKITF